MTTLTLPRKEELERSAVKRAPISITAKTAHAHVAVAFGDGIGPEIMQATLDVLDAAHAKLRITQVSIGQALYRAGFSAGIDPASWNALRGCDALLKAPITTPSGGGYKSPNVTLRKMLGLYASVRPAVSYAPYVHTLHPRLDLIVVRENEEDLYAGIEHRQTDDVYQCLKLVSRSGCEKIARYAFEFARANARKRVTCITKDNIMKMTDGLFRRVFDEVGAEYPDIDRQHLLMDIGTARLATQPEQFDVIVAPNLYGDILSDVAAALSGSVALSPAANIGAHGAMFETVHGSATELAGQDVANPSALIASAVMMLTHIGQADVAQRVHHAWLRTLEDGVHTADLYESATSKQRAGTKAFARALIERLGETPRKLQRGLLQLPEPPEAKVIRDPRITSAAKEMVGVDVFLHWRGGNGEALAQRLRALDSHGASLLMITNRGAKVWPNGLPETYCTDHWRCRFMVANGQASLSHAQIRALLGSIDAAGLDVIKTETLCTFDDEPGYSLGHGQ